MKYLVSCQSSTYQAWQMELLIESFKMHNLQDDLIVAMAGTNPVDNKYTRNIRAHQKNTYILDDLGASRKCLPANKIYACLSLLAHGHLKQPFCLIEPDMVLCKPILPPHSSLTFQLDQEFTKEYLEAQGIHVSAGLEAMLKERNMPDVTQWFPVGHVYSFKDVPNEVFQEAWNWIERLQDDRMHWDLGRAAWARAFMDWYGHLEIEGTYEYEMTMLDRGLEHNFIHYKHGLPPTFHKRQYTLDQEVVLGSFDPYAPFLDNNPTTSTNYLQKVVESYLGKI